MLTCPNCKAGLLRRKVDGSVFWACSACDGRMVRTNMLRRMASDEAVHALWSSAREGKGEPKRTCPVCNKLMACIPVTLGARSVPLDVCTNCRFVWFDRREYELFTATPAENAEPTKLVDQKWKWIPVVFGMPVERQTATLLDRPLLTWGLAALIALVSLLAFAILDRAVAGLGLIPAELWRYGGLTFLTSFFLHGGFFHLMGNLYFLLVFGDNVEDYLGRARYLLLLLGATLLGDLLHIALDPRSQLPVIGASGGISGLIAFYGLQFPNARLAVLSRWTLFYPLKMRARTALLLWILWQVFGVWQQVAGLSHVSSLAHLGGGGVGLAFWLKWRKS